MVIVRVVVAITIISIIVIGATVVIGAIIIIRVCMGSSYPLSSSFIIHGIIILMVNINVRVHTLITRFEIAIVGV